MRSSEEKVNCAGGSVGTGGAPTVAQQNNNGNSNQNPKIRIAVFGQHEVGKSALTVRYLTKRYIGEYKSNTDLLYQQTVTIGSSSIDVEIVDISTSEVPTSSKRKSFPVEEIQRADGFVIVYSITDRSSFQFAQDALQTITNYHNNQMQISSTPNPNSLSPAGSTSSSNSSASSSPNASPQPRPTCPILLVANKLDLEHLRVVEKVEGLSTSMQYGCHFYELSVAENSPEVYTSFQSLISQFITFQQKEPSKRKFSVSKMLGSLRLGRTSPSHQNQVVTSQASVVDTDILSSSNESSISRGPSPVPSASSSCASESSSNNNFSSLKNKIVELQSIKKRQNSPPICSL